MTSTPALPLVERADAVMEAVARRVARTTGLRDDDPATQRRSADTALAPTDERTIDEPVNPLRHWRWE